MERKPELHLPQSQHYPLHHHQVHPHYQARHIVNFHHHQEVSVNQCPYHHHQEVNVSQCQHQHHQGENPNQSRHQHLLEVGLNPPHPNNQRLLYLVGHNRSHYHLIISPWVSLGLGLNHFQLYEQPMELFCEKTLRRV